MANTWARFWYGVILVAVLVGAASLAIASDVTFRGVLPTRDHNRVWIFFDVKVLGETVPHSHVAPAGLSKEQYRAWVQKRESRWKKDVLKEMYPEAPKKIKRGGLGRFLAWIASGAIVRHCYRPGPEEDEVCTEYAAKRHVISNRAHPRRLGLKAQIDDAATVDEKIDIIIDYLLNR